MDYRYDTGHALCQGTSDGFVEVNTIVGVDVRRLDGSRHYRRGPENR